MIVICDIDGVLANCNHRLHYLKEKDYDKFYSEEEMLQDVPIWSGNMLVSCLSQQGRVIFVTGRPYRAESQTRDFIDEYIDLDRSLPYELLMRKNHDYRPASVVKVEMIKEWLEENPKGEGETIFFIDDDPKNVQAVEENIEDCQGILFGASRLDLK